MHPQHAKIKTAFQHVFINLFYTWIWSWLAKFEGFLNMSPQRNQSQAFVLGWKMAVVVWYLYILLSYLILTFYPNLTQVLRVIFLTIHHNMIFAYFPVFNLWIYQSAVDCTSSQNFLLASWGHLSFYTGTGDFPWDLWWPSEQQAML